MRDQVLGGSGRYIRLPRTLAHRGIELRQRPNIGPRILVALLPRGYHQPCWVISAYGQLIPRKEGLFYWFFRGASAKVLVSYPSPGVCLVATPSVSCRRRKQ